MFPLMHVKAAVDIAGYFNDDLILGSLLPDVLRLSGCHWGRSHKAANFLKSVLGKCHNITVGSLLHGESPPGADYFSDVSFLNVPWGWAFYTAWRYSPKYLKKILPVGLLPWLLHNMVEAAVDLYIYESWNRDLIDHIADISSWDVSWEEIDILVKKSGLKTKRKLKQAYVDYLSISLKTYGEEKGVFFAIYEILRRKLYRHGFIIDIPSNFFEEFWYKLYVRRSELYYEYVRVSYPYLKETYERWCLGEI